MKNYRDILYGFLLADWVIVLFSLIRVVFVNVFVKAEALTLSSPYVEAVILGLLGAALLLLFWKERLFGFKLWALLLCFLVLYGCTIALPMLLPVSLSPEQVPYQKYANSTGTVFYLTFVALAFLMRKKNPYIMLGIWLYLGYEAIGSLLSLGFNVAVYLGMPVKTALFVKLALLFCMIPLYLLVRNRIQSVKPWMLVLVLLCWLSPFVRSLFFIWNPDFFQIPEESLKYWNIYSPMALAANVFILWFFLVLFLNAQRRRQQKMFALK